MKKQTLGDVDHSRPYSITFFGGGVPKEDSLPPSSSGPPQDGADEREEDRGLGSIFEHTSNKQTEGEENEDTVETTSDGERADPELQTPITFDDQPTTHENNSDTTLDVDEEEGDPEMESESDDIIIA